MKDTEPKSATNITIDSYIAKMMLSGRPVEVTAAKLGLSVEAVKSRWEYVQKMAKERPENGLTELRGHQLLLLDQFALLGTSMSIIANTVNNVVSREELVAVLVSACGEGEDRNLIDLNDVADVLLKKLIILKPFTLPSPEKMIEEHRNGVVGN